MRKVAGVLKTASNSENAVEHMHIHNRTAHQAKRGTSAATYHGLHIASCAELLHAQPRPVIVACFVATLKHSNRLPGSLCCASTSLQFQYGLNMPPYSLIDFAAPAVFVLSIVIAAVPWSDPTLQEVC